jgi:hypothetical protein
MLANAIKLSHRETEICYEIGTQYDDDDDSVMIREKRSHLICRQSLGDVVFMSIAKYIFNVHGVNVNGRMQKQQGWMVGLVRGMKKIVHFFCRRAELGKNEKCQVAHYEFVRGRMDGWMVGWSVKKKDGFRYSREILFPKCFFL